MLWVIMAIGVVKLAASIPARSVGEGKHSEFLAEYIETLKARGYSRAQAEHDLSESFEAAFSNANPGYAVCRTLGGIGVVIGTIACAVSTIWVSLRNVHLGKWVMVVCVVVWIVNAAASSVLRVNSRRKSLEGRHEPARSDMRDALRRIEQPEIAPSPPVFVVISIVSVVGFVIGCAMWVLSFFVA